MQEFKSSDTWILLAGCVFSKTLEGAQFILVEEPLGLWVDDANKDVLEGLIIGVLLLGHKNVLEDLLLGNDCIIKVVDYVNQEKMSNFVSAHFLKGLLKRLHDDFPVFSIQDVEKSAGN